MALLLLLKCLFGSFQDNKVSKELSIKYLLVTILYSIFFFKKIMNVYTVSVQSNLNIQMTRIFKKCNCESSEKQLFEKYRLDEIHLIRIRMILDVCSSLVDYSRKDALQYSRH